MPRNTSALKNLGEIVETAARLGFIIVTWCYVVGLLILNLHLAQYGLFRPAFLRVEYVLSGALWTFLVGFTLCLFHYVALPLGRAGETKSRALRTTSGIKALPKAAVALSALVYVLFIVSDSELGFRSPSQRLNTLLVLAILAFTAWVILDLIRIIQMIANLAHRDSEGSTNVMRAVGIPVLLQIAALLPAISAYALFAFPRLPSALGGGQRQLITFVPKPEQQEALMRLGLPASSGGSKIGPLEIIFEASDFIAVLPPKELDPKKEAKAIRIRKDMIDGIIHLKRQDGLRSRPLT